MSQIKRRRRPPGSNSHYRNSEEPHGTPFSARIKLLPGLHLNLSKSGVGVSVGGRGAHIGVTARGQRDNSVGVPGARVSWRECHGTAAFVPTRCHIPLVAVGGDHRNHDNMHDYQD